jgi:hypothetical protein
MAAFRIRVGLNRGHGPVDYRSLSELTDEIDSFLRRIGEDAGLPIEANRWIATNVADGSFMSTGVPAIEIGTGTVDSLGQMVDAILRGDARQAQNLGVSDQTRLQYDKLAKKADSRRIPVEFGLYKSEAARRPKWYPVTIGGAKSLLYLTSPFVEYSGAIQGVIHAWYKESDEPHFQLRDQTKNSLIKCYYNSGQYPDVLKAVARRDERVHVSGTIHANRLDKTIESIKVARIKNPVEFSDAEFERFFGCAPSIAGDLSSADFIEKVRGSDA